MSRTNTGWHEARKMLWCALVLAFVIILICQSSLWAGPMGDPEPTSSDSSLFAEDTHPDYGAEESVMSDLELALYLAGLL